MELPRFPARPRPGRVPGRQAAAACLCAYYSTILTLCQSQAGPSTLHKPPPRCAHFLQKVGEGACPCRCAGWPPCRSEEHTSELQSRFDLVCRRLLVKKNQGGNHCIQ